MTSNKKSQAVGLTLTLLVSALAGCSAPGKSTMTTNPKPAAAPANNGPKEAVAPPQTVLAGKVVETINAGSYTYLRLEKDGKSGWAAVPAVNVAIGEEVELIPGIDMGRFTSASMKRTFDNIHFSAGLKQPGNKTAQGQAAALPPGHPSTTPAPAAALPPGHPKTDGAAAKPAGSAPAANLITGKIVETSNAGGYTYLCLEKDGKKTWAAIPATKVAVGSEISILPGSEMNDFTSPSLKRTFDKIIFSPGAAK